MRNASAIEKPRGFLLHVRTAGPNVYGITLEETNGNRAAGGKTVLSLSPQQTSRVMPALMEAVRASGHGKTVLSPNREAPIRLKEESGVRLALVLLATQPVGKSRRIQEMIDAISGMTSEEVYYWYAKVTGPERGRLRRALRLFLAHD
jgi:hypothetical protein